MAKKAKKKTAKKVAKKTTSRPAKEGQVWPAAAVESKPLTWLKPYDRNARTHSDDQVDAIARSIEEFGWTQPVLADPRGMIIAGHGRVAAAKKLGLAEVPVMIARGWTKDQKRAYVLADNRLAEKAGWDKDLLRIERQELETSGFDVDLTGFSTIDVKSFKRLTPDSPKPDAAADGPISAVGDVWHCGGHELVCVDMDDPEAASELILRSDPVVFIVTPDAADVLARLWEEKAGVEAFLEDDRTFNQVAEDRGFEIVEEDV